ncbi:hypothetical protein GCM10007392_23410 [Saccharospirillum salsuginis]|uniref:Uncharacterized protein n=1 Tax=Saccharospirillum salsuginis TaxID=418750 RepID=A0A918K8R5_9GAMM|nr:hypothetical protein GCM10007392_23410 [Saccharospirillum salsuginis]
MYKTIVKLLFGVILVFFIVVPAIMTGYVKVPAGTATLREVGYAEHPIEFLLWVAFDLGFGLYCLKSAIWPSSSQE